MQLCRGDKSVSISSQAMALPGRKSCFPSKAEQREAGTTAANSCFDRRSSSRKNVTDAASVGGETSGKAGETTDTPVSSKSDIRTHFGEKR